jgi:hypothetical protein
MTHVDDTEAQKWAVTKMLIQGQTALLEALSCQQKQIEFISNLLRGLLDMQAEGRSIDSTVLDRARKEIAELERILGLPDGDSKTSGGGNVVS